MPRTRLGRLLLAFVALIVLGGGGIVFAMCSAKPGGPTALAASSTASPTPDPTMPLLVDGPELAGMMADPPTKPFLTSSGPAVLSTVEAEPIQLPTGRLVAADVFFLFDAKPFAATLSPGETPVTVLVAEFPGDDKRVAAILVGDRDALGDPAVTWTPATLAGGVALPPDRIPAFGVDSGTAGFTSAEGAARIAADDGYDDRMLEALEGAGFTEPVHVALDDARTLDEVAVPSGFGDGAYATWVGTDPDGTARAFLTSFDILDRASPTAPALSTVPALSSAPSASA
jgi:hypothetical protein